MAKQIKKLEDLTPDSNNFNRHTEFGSKLLEDSLRKFGEVTNHEDKGEIKSLSPQMQQVFQNLKPSDTGFQHVLLRIEGRESGFGQCIYQPHLICPTITTGRNTSILAEYPRRILRDEVCKCGTYPQDYLCESDRKLEWLIGMSVPPVMTAQISNQIYLQWLSKIINHE